MSEINKSYQIIRTSSQVEELIGHINSLDVFALDTETTTVNPRKGDIVGWSVTGEVGRGWYLPVLKWDGEKLEELTINGRPASEVSKKLLSLLKGKKLIFHNASFDIQYIKNRYGIDFMDELWVDTMLLVHTVNEEGAFGYGNPFGLKSIAISIQQEIGLDLSRAANQEQLELKESIKLNGGSVTKENFEIFKADMEILGKYAAADVDLTLRICNHFLKVLKKEDLEDFFFNQEVMPLYKEVTIPMEEYGVALDLELLEDARVRITKDLEVNKEVVMKSLLTTSEGKQWVVDTALKEFPPSSKGNWAQMLVTRYSLSIPRSEKTGKYSITKPNVDKLEDSPIKTFLQTGDIKLLDPTEVVKISLQMWKDFNEGEYINIQSKKHLGEVVFKYMGEKPKTKTTKGADQFDMDMLEELSKKYEWAENLRVYNKLLKIKSTYIDRFLDNHEDGRYYFYFKQHGTVSGRYGSDAQQLPKPKEEGEDAPIIVHYNNLVRAFLVAGPGRELIDSDYTSLEPHCFASVSGDIKLQEIFEKGWDFYSTVAIQTEKLEGVSPDSKAPNFLKKVNPVKRNQAKAYSLGIAYGMEAFALSKTLNIPQKEAEVLVDGYLDGFPQLKEWRENSRKFVKENGYIKNKVGRIRHLPDVMRIYSKFGDKLLDWRFRNNLFEKYPKDQVMKIYRDYKNGLNNCLNYQLQSLAAAVVNRAAIQINRKLKELGVDGRVQAQIHDQLIINVPEGKAKELAPIIQDLMENTTHLPGVTLKAPPALALNFRDGH